MTITYPLALPATPSFSGVTVRKMPVVGMSVSPYTGAQQTVVYTGQWWEMDLILPTMPDDQMASWEAFLGKLNGQEGTFLIGDPSRKAARGICATTPGVPLVDGAVVARSQSLPIKGGPALVQDWIKEGDYMQIGTGSAARLYQALADADTNSSGETELDVWPRIRTALAGNEVITFNAPKGVFRMASNVNEITKRVGIFGNLSFSVREAL